MTEIERRLNIFINLQFEPLYRMSIQRQINAIGWVESNRAIGAGTEW